MPTIVIADDSMFQRFQTSKTAIAAGFDVYEAKDGQECLRLMLEKRPDVLLLDLNMPALDGLAVLGGLAAEGAMPARVYVLTADIQDTTRKRCMELGAYACINKPVDQVELGAILSQARAALA
jgi:CheY-like chemotaxis protein